MTPSRFFQCALTGIDATVRLRPVDSDRVAALAASMSEIGLQQPIVVRPGKGGANTFVLVAGAHRLDAARKLEWKEIPAIWLDPDEATAQLIEIDENLIRNELSALDFAVSVARRKAIYEALHPETKHGKASPKKDTEGKVANIATFLRFSKDAAKRTGLPERTFQYAADLMMKLSPEVIDVLRSTRLANNGGALRKLSFLSPDKQLGAAKALAAGEAKTVSTALVAAGFTPPPIASDPTAMLIDKWTDVLARQSATVRRALIMEALRAMKAGEFTALANDLVNVLPVSRQKPLHAALTKVLAAYQEDV